MILTINNGIHLRIVSTEQVETIPQYSDIQLPDITINDYAVQGEIQENNSTTT